MLVKHLSPLVQKILNASVMVDFIIGALAVSYGVFLMAEESPCAIPIVIGAVFLVAALIEKQLVLRSEELDKKNHSFARI